MLTCLYSSRIPEKAALHQARARCAAGELSAQDTAVTLMLLGRMWLLQKVSPGIISSKQTDMYSVRARHPTHDRGGLSAVGGGEGPAPSS